jgi:hypothetical protein
MPAKMGAGVRMKTLHWLGTLGLAACVGPSSATLGTSTANTTTDTAPTADTGTADTGTADTGTADTGTASDTDTGVASGAWDAVPCEAALADCMAASTMVGARVDDYRETTYDSCGLWSDLVKFEPGSTGVIYASHAVRGVQGHLLREETDNAGDGSVERVSRLDYDAMGQLVSIRTDGNGDGIDEEVQGLHLGGRPDGGGARDHRADHLPRGPPLRHRRGLARHHDGRQRRRAHQPADHLRTSTTATTSSAKTTTSATTGASTRSSATPGSTGC